MGKTDINYLFARNLDAKIRGIGGELVKKNDKINQVKVGKLAEVSQKNISNILSILKPEKHPTEASSPTLSTVAKLAAAVKMQPWQMICPELAEEKPLNVLELNGAEGVLVGLFRQLGQDEKTVIIGLASDLAAGASKLVDVTDNEAQIGLRPGVVTDPAGAKHK